MTDIALSTALVAFTSPIKGYDGKAATFQIKPGGVVERELFEAELAARWRAPKVYHFQLCDALADGVRALAEKEDQPRLLEVIRLSRAAEKLSKEDEALLVETERLMANAWPEFRILQERQVQRGSILPLVAFMWFVKGWDDAVPGKIAFTADEKVAEAALAHVHPLDIRTVGNEAYAMLYGGGHAKNSAALSGSGESQETSNSDSASPADGKSTGKSGRKTPATS
ncbi:hypothetical protein BSL82_02300 [Tardibacter chloracetimidivorans]|uniref:Uncharacterized protein n=1 Tax=Tardibacter chloracetimidivorans TaxID=1921510 RepID=A0A1L3ZRN0_9SPHN|nr:hypothetical protein [Tardibacter chloracetimidivorans]API58279.1 hypothetical protein BSL82_02300 [Tardibacter chloracetimidivorans]